MNPLAPAPAPVRDDARVPEAGADSEDADRIVWEGDIWDEPGGDLFSSPPDPLTGVLEVDTMMSIFAAHRYVRIDEMRLAAIEEARRHDLRSREMAERSLRLELASALRVTEHAAARLIAQAEALVHRYPTVLDSLSAARLTDRHVDALVETLDSVEPEVSALILERALALAEAEPVGTFRRRLRSLVDTARHDTLAERHEQAASARRVVVEAADDGMAWLMALMPAVEARAIHHRLTAIAKVLGDRDDETRTRDQLRADALSDLLIDGETSVHPPESRGIRATVAITVPVLSLLDESGTAGSGPAIVEGVGPIPIDVARGLCGGADGWMRILTHPETGAVLSVGREQYRPPPILKKIARWRAGRCMGPGCGVPAARCELDHTIAWEHGGHTSLDNLAPLCTGHHTLKHHGGWTVTQIAGSGGALEWRSPAGRRYVVEPERPMPVFRPVVEFAPDVASSAGEFAPF